MRRALVGGDARGWMAGANIVLLTNAMACGRLAEVSADDASVSDAHATASDAHATASDAHANRDAPPSTSGAEGGADGNGFHDAANEDASVCQPPESVCIDDSTLRTWYPALDGDACTFKFYDMQCGMSPVAPDCFQGGCRIVIIR